MNQWYHILDVTLTNNLSDHRFGYKLLALCSSDGVPHKVAIYEGRTEENEIGPYGSRIVLKLSQIRERPEKHHVFMDNFFTSYDLFVNLKEKEIQGYWHSKRKQTETLSCN